MNNNNMPRTPIRNALKERSRHVLRKHPKIKVGEAVEIYHVSNGRMVAGIVLRKSAISLPKYPGQNHWVIDNGAQRYTVPFSRIYKVDVNSNNNW
jgi:hypothetical protein